MGIAPSSLSAAARSRRFIAIFIALIIILLFSSLHQGDPRHAARRAYSRYQHRGDKLNDVYNATLGFEDILVIGLPSRTDRRDAMTLTAALSDMRLTFVDGVIGDNISEKAIPMTEDREHMSGANLGSWRGHMNAVYEVVRRNLSSALIMEDDIDWDIRIKDQVRDVALASRALSQPLRGQPGRYADPTYPNPVHDSPPKVPDMDFFSLPNTETPKISPYGDNWDVLWLGHCSMSFAFEDNDSMAKGRVVKLNDESAPPKSALWSLNSPFSLVEDYPEHARVFHHAQEGLCTLAYAISQRGAQKMLREVALKPATDAFDFLLRFYCEGRPERTITKQECLTVNPTLFSHHRARGPLSAASDIGNHGDDFRTTAYTDMIRQSVRMNAEVILNGSTKYIDQYPDEPEEKADLE